MLNKAFYELVRTAPKGRWNGIQRTYGPDDVYRLRGGVQIQYTLAVRIFEIFSFFSLNFHRIRSLIGYFLMLGAYLTSNAEPNTHSLSIHRQFNDALSLKFKIFSDQWSEHAVEITSNGALCSCAWGDHWEPSNANGPWRIARDLFVW